MTAKQARRAAKILRDMATSLLWEVYPDEHHQNKFKTECCDLAEALEDFAETRQFLEVVIESFSKARKEIFGASSDHSSRLAG